VAKREHVPVLLSDGTRFVITAIGEAWGVTLQGARRFRTDLTSVGRDIPRGAACA